ncbi:D-alanine--D-alanine ligase [Cyanobacterium stanieri LEGE 03274]|uniref:D-alanine--D-alanine ligase n=1 Tax=Cyanobacterium stanieri LEGE 03274 TaxID=1828756 RepID=A0ABR9V1C6_9CHRO|nr:D-alanine--D-alanine ligase [Cyanobacterium stanieri]MBE9221697.1 D-alanine--D-alanine ligase [Cyanobacterium stanieri LEGE 03274]
MFTPENPLKVLHIGGSLVSDFYDKLSLLYLKEVVKPPAVKAYYAIVHPDGLWQQGDSLENLSAPQTLSDFLKSLPLLDVVVPHLFCQPGMTTIRGFFEDMLGLPVVGSKLPCTSLATNKAHTRDVVSANGVLVAKGQLLKRGDEVRLKPPFIIKPNGEDNSLGITLVKDESQMEEALKLGFQYDSQLLAEEFIPGREIRAVVIERGDKLQVLPMIEYLVNDANPIRTTAEKLQLKDDGMPQQQTPQPNVKAICPAHLSPELETKLSLAVINAHGAIGCRDYSLYDFRIHQDTDEPYLLEAGLFWAFSNISMISKMLLANGEDLESVIFEVWCNALHRHRK